jgi:hypothetical protein
MDQFKISIILNAAMFHTAQGGFQFRRFIFALQVINALDVYAS